MVQVTEPETQMPEIRLVMVEAKARRESQPLIAETDFSPRWYGDSEPATNQQRTGKKPGPPQESAPTHSTYVQTAGQ